MLFCLLLVQCSTQNKLPNAQKIVEHPYGAMLSVKHQQVRYYGELIAADSNRIVLLNQKDSRMVELPANQITRYRLFFAKSNAFIVPAVLTVATPFMHGFFFFFTAPANALVTASVAYSGVYDFRYTEKECPVNKLHQFARFPGGLPEDIRMEDLK